MVSITDLRLVSLILYILIAYSTRILAAFKQKH